MDDFEVSMSDEPDFDLSDSTEFPETEMVESIADVSDEIPLEEEGVSFQEPEFSEGDVEVDTDVNSIEEANPNVIDGGLSDSEQGETPDYNEPTAEIPQEEINSQSVQTGLEQIPEGELIESIDDVSDEIPLDEDRATFQDPEFSEGDIEVGTEVNSTEEVGPIYTDSDLSDSKQGEIPVYDEPIEEFTQDEINSQLDQTASEQMPEAEEYASETPYEQEPESNVIVPEITSEDVPEVNESEPESDHAQELEGYNDVPKSTAEQAPQVEDSAIKLTPDQVSEDDQTDSKSTPEIFHAEDEVGPEALEPNVVYERNGYEYKTDEMGRTQLVTGDLNLTEGNRTKLQTEVGHLGVEGDEGGHLIGTRFSGPTDAFNLVPQDANLNRGEWKAMENSWADALSNGQDVKVMVRPVFGDASVRPESFEVLSQVDGELTYTSFLNQPSSKTEGEKIG